MDFGVNIQKTRDFLTIFNFKKGRWLAKKLLNTSRL